MGRICLTGRLILESIAPRKWCYMDVSQIMAYLNGWEDAPSAQAVFDHFWSVLEYALSAEEKEELRSFPVEQGVEALFFLGGEVWNASPKIDLVKPYGTWRTGDSTTGRVGDYSFEEPRRPIDDLRAGRALGRNMSMNVICRLNGFDWSGLARAVHVYRRGELAGVLYVDPEGRWHGSSLEKLFSEVVSRMGSEADRSLREVLDELGLAYEEPEVIRFTDYFHDEEVRKDIYSVDGIIESELLGNLGVYDGGLGEEECSARIAELIGSSILGYLIRTRGEREVCDYLRTLDYPYVTNWCSHAPERDIFPSHKTGKMLMEALPDVVEAVGNLSVRDAANQLDLLAQGERRLMRTCFKRSMPSASRIERLAQKPFSYSRAERSLEGVWGGVRFELPKTPKQLLLLGARFGSPVSKYAWRSHRLSWERPGPTPVLLFDEETGDFLDNLRYYDRYQGRESGFNTELGSTETWEEIEQRLGLSYSIRDAIWEWLKDDNTAVFGF